MTSGGRAAHNSRTVKTPSLPAASALLASCLFAATSFSSIAAEPAWPRFRGPNGSGLSDAKLPDPLTEKSIAWKVELPGAGHSSPAIAGDRIFITANPENTGDHILLCLKARDGSVVWKKEFQTGTFRQHADNNYASSTPALDDERVFVCWMSPEGSGLAALSQDDGKELWRKELGAFVSQHGPGVSPIVADDLVLLDFDPDRPGSFLAAFDAKSGAEKWRWKHEGNKHSSSTPCIYQPKSGGRQVVTISNATGMTGLDLQTGTVAWQLPDIMPKRCVASPIVTNGGLLVGQCGEGQAESFVHAVKVADDGKSAEVAYQVRRVGGYVPTPIAVGENLFLWKENGLVTCLRAADNTQVWSERVQGPFYGSPIAVDGKLYNMTRRGDLVILSAGDSFKELARIPLGEGSHATPAAAGDRLYCRTFTHLIAFGKQP